VPLSESRLANLGARAIYAGFDAYHARFRAITRRARARFEQRDWRGLRLDGTDRLDLYRQHLDPLIADLQTLLGDRVEERLIWASMKAVYSGLIADRGDWEVAETFFNSITRRVFTTVGVDHAIEFVDTDFDTPPVPPMGPVYRVYDGPMSALQLVRAVLADYRHAVPYADEAGDAERAARRLATRAPLPIERAEVLNPVFYRNKGAYLIGRIWSGGNVVPVAMALLHPPEGIVVDALLLDENDLSIVFSFAHSYFHVDVERAHELVSFLRGLMPRKRVAEIYISLGYHKHGKTELYRDLLHYMATTQDRFEVAPGQRGMVMEVFTLPSYDLVLKVIRDRFASPKRATRRSVMQKYRMVFRHDRAGRLVDAQEFEHLEFPRERFSPRLLETLLEEAGTTVQIMDDHVAIRHAYIERRVTPLDVFLREAADEAATAAALDYGRAIKDLAASNIFPGDFWLKNFGVTRHGRVVFYDYDELCALTDCQFAPLPEPRDELEELADEAWFYVGDRDVFPEEFRRFMRLPRGLNDSFLEHHADLFELAFWQDLQARLQAGELLDIFPYMPARRLRASSATTPAVSSASISASEQPASRSTARVSSPSNGPACARRTWLTDKRIGEPS
jgi:isocitrate dehydrogenase kinase/phosphatase